MCKKWTALKRQFTNSGLSFLLAGKVDVRN